MTHALPSAHITSGQPITRVDGQLKVTGRAAYAADNHIAGVVYAVLVCSTVGSGGIERIETRAATGLPEVLRVFTDFTGLKLPFDARQVSFFGQPVAVVVATTGGGDPRCLTGDRAVRRSPSADEYRCGSSGAAAGA